VVSIPKRKLERIMIHVRVIGHGIGGKVIPAKMAQLAESQSYDGPPSSPDLIDTQIVMALKSKYVDTTH
jgi:hypothetical protein